MGKQVISQEAIDALLGVISDEELIGFTKSYLGTHPEMFTALKEKFMPSSEKKLQPFDYKKEVDACFRHILKTPNWGRRRYYEPDYLDWEEVGKDLLRVIKRAEMCLANDNPETAINTALYILKTNERQYEEEYLCEREDWDPEDMHIEECMSLIENAFKSPLISKVRKLDVCDELEHYDSSCIFDYISGYSREHLIETTRKTLLTDEEQLEIIKRNFRNATPGFRKSEYALEIWNFLINKGRKDDAVAFFHENNNYNNLRQKYVNLLISSGETEKALAAIDDGIAIAQKASHSGVVSEWRICKLSLYESMNDTVNILAICREMFKDAHTSDVLKYYNKIKSLIPTEEWPSYRDELLKTRNFNRTANNSLAEIFVEEHLLDRLYDHLLHSDYALLSALEAYAKYFTHEEQQKLVARLEKELCHEFSFGTNRSTYQNLADRISRLKKTCPSGKKMAEKVISYYLTKYRNRPALREELQKVR